MQFVERDKDIRLRGVVSGAYFERQAGFTDELRKGIENM
jgi:hypothetical protein